MEKIENFYVLADGTQADPADVSKGDDGVLRHKNGMAVAMKADGKPETIADRTAENVRALNAGKTEAEKKQAAEQKPNDLLATTRNVQQPVEHPEPKAARRV